MSTHKNTFSEKRSIRSQVIIFLITGISLMTIIIGYITLKAVNSQTRQIMVTNAKQITQGLAKQSVFSLLSGSKQNAKDAMERTLGFPSVVSAYIITDNGTVFNDVTILDKQKKSLYRPYILNNGVPILETTLFKETNQYWSFISPIKINEKDSEYDEESEFEFEVNEDSEINIGYVEVLYSKKNLKEAEYQITLNLSYVGLISVLILGVILHIGLTRLFTPLQRLAKTMQEAQSNKDHLYTQVSGAKEIREIGRSYNQLMAVLEEQDEFLKQNRNILEKEVEIRTKELVLARDSALIASRHKSEFIANISHELRTPIQSIMGYSELVLEELEAEGNIDAIQDMDKITNNSQRLLSLINSLLDLAKIESGKMEVHYSNHKLIELVNNLCDTITPLSKINNNTFIISNQSDLEYVNVDVAKTEQVMLNLLSNACKFTKNDNVELSVTNSNRELIFMVKDAGLGLTPEQQEYIFEEFKQVDSSQARLFSGTGLGLAISKRFIELMEGSISVSSELGKGSTFTVKIPFSH